jgi:hypothetical protein
VIADKLALEAKIQEGERAAFWEEFEDRLGPVGSDPAGFYSFEIGHVLHVTPDDLAELTPSDLLAALHFFDAMYRGN